MLQMVCRVDVDMPRQLVVDDNTDNVVTSKPGHEIIIYV